MTQAGYAFLGLTAIVAALAAVLVFAMLRFAANARDARRSLKESGDTPLLAAALQEAVAKLKAQEQAMTARAAASEQLSGDIVESLTAGLLVVDGSSRVEIFNGAGRAMVGVKSDPIGSDYQKVLAAFPPLVELIGECLSTARPIVRRTVQVEGTGPMHLGVTVSPLGKPLPHGVICLFSDLTSVVELEEQLRLKETLARLGELTAGLAHEFRNGLATIHGYSRLIDVDALTPKYRPYVEGIRQEADSLGKVVTNFLSFARPENLALSRVDLEAVIRRATDDLRYELPAETSLTVDGTFAEILGDEVLLRQVFGNLVRNAVDACEGAGVTPDIRIRGWVDVAHHSCRVSVDDNGPGIPEASRERIFQPFFTTRSQGTGLGLAIVQKIVVMHNGRVIVADARGGGASIQISIPTAET
ncbi:MAG TPA: ATP-binding protein [Vicinamibacterales bacterium]|jgi:nitrogen fixation/metabolism regulation signal transduction histidine kinase|nr:ATP-binding protein [Vicinamibacterales bacterium]